MAKDRSVLVEAYAHIGRLRGAQPNKVCTDALKLLALRESLPLARLILAFADQEAAASIAGWRATVLERNGISIMVAKLPEAQRESIEDVQRKQRMINAPVDADG